MSTNFQARDCLTSRVQHEASAPLPVRGTGRLLTRRSKEGTRGVFPDPLFNLAITLSIHAGVWESPDLSGLCRRLFTLIFTLIVCDRWGLGETRYQRCRLLFAVALVNCERRVWEDPDHC